MAGSEWEREVAERLGRIEEKLDGVTERLADGHQLHLNHGKRIGALERWRAWILGALAVLGFGVIALLRIM